VRDRKRMLRLLIDDVTLARNEELINVHIRWKGGATTLLELPRPRSNFELIRTPVAVINEIRALATDQTDDQIACTLNSRGYRSGAGNSFTRHRIAYIRSCHGIESYHQHLQRNGWLTLPEVAREIGVHPHTAWTYAKRGFCASFETMPSISCLNHRPSDLPLRAPAKGVVPYLVNVTNQLREEVQYETHAIIRSRHSSLTDRIKRSIFGFKLGERGGKRRASTPASSSVTRNASENFVSRSISRYFLPCRNPSSASVRFLETWSIHGWSGLAVLPAK